jgi:hypothetical protein
VSLAALFGTTLRVGERGIVSARLLLETRGWRDGATARADELWRHLLEATLFRDGTAAEHHGPLELMLTHGPLARRIVTAVGGAPDRSVLRSAYGLLCDCLAAGRMFVP